MTKRIRKFHIDKLIKEGRGTGVVAEYKLLIVKNLK
jgi:hypothetical protein